MAANEGVFEGSCQGAESGTTSVSHSVIAAEPAMDHLSQASSAVLPVLALDVHQSGGQEAKEEAKVQPPLNTRQLL